VNILIYRLKYNLKYMWNKELLEMCSRYPKHFKQTPFYRDWLPTDDGCLRRENIKYIMDDYEFEYYNNRNNLETVSSLLRISLRDYQYKAIDDLKTKKYNLLFTSRQVGTTTIIAFSILMKILNTEINENSDNYNIAICTRSISSSTELIDKIKKYYTEIPIYMKPGVTMWNQTSIGFDNGINITTYVLNGSNINGLSFNSYNLPNDFIAYDIGHILNFEKFYSNISSVFASFGTNIILVSGFNTNKFIRDIINDGNSTFNKIILNYDVVPGRDEKWISDTMSMFGSRKEFESEFIYKPIQKEKVDRIITKISDIETYVYKENIVITDKIVIKKSELLDLVELIKKLD